MESVSTRTILNSHLRPTLTTLKARKSLGRGNRFPDGVKLLKFYGKQGEILFDEYCVVGRLVLV